MSSDTNTADIPSEVASIVQRYRRLERPVSWAMGLLVSGTIVAVFFLLSLIPALLVAIGVVLVIRLPAFRSYGTTILETDANSEAVRADFESATPPSLALQWGLASSIQSTSNSWVYNMSYMFGLQSTNMAVELHPHQSDNGEDNIDFKLVVTANERPWGTYTVSIRKQDGKTKVHTEYVSDRRFGLRRIPQWFVAKRYRDETLVAQGFTIIEQDRNLGV
jgi:hypothetical protein